MRWVGGRGDDVAKIKRAVKQETLDRFAKKVSRRKNRSIEPKNSGPTGYAFAKVIGRLGSERSVHGTVLRRLKEPAG